MSLSLFTSLVTDRSMVRIAVLGCGTMGLKIAGCLPSSRSRCSSHSFLAGNFAYFGHIVKIYDSGLKQLDSVCERIRHDEDELYRDGLIETPKFTVSGGRRAAHVRFRRAAGSNPLFEPHRRRRERCGIRLRMRLRRHGREEAIARE